MKVCQIIASYGEGGLEKPVRELTQQMLPPELIVPVGNAAALRERLLSLLGNMEGWESLMHAPRQFAREHMTKQAMCSNTLATYENLLNPDLQAAP